MSFHLQCRPMRGPDINGYDITSQYTIYMVNTLLIELVSLREDQQRLILLTTILDNNRSLASPIILIIILLSWLRNFLVVEQELDVLQY